MLRVGLTGGVACGKTTVAEMMRQRGAHVVLADEVAHQLMRPGEPVYYEIVRHFGPDIVGSDGAIDRKKLAEAAFGSGRIKELNQIVHPAVIARQQAWTDEVAAKHPDGIAVVEAALILEAGVGKRFDKLVVVICTMPQKIERFARRHNLDLAAAEREVTRRMAAQLPEEEKARAADYVIDNSGPLADLEVKVDALMAELRRLAQNSIRRG
ncbi:MAG TPA: dephospho-CoA kinase [Terriglobales bacterium]|nr:dephospho-CoA kinase [Terriglobales bacterium]